MNLLIGIASIKDKGIKDSALLRLMIIIIKCTMKTRILCSDPRMR